MAAHCRGHLCLRITAKYLTVLPGKKGKKKRDHRRHLHGRFVPSIYPSRICKNDLQRPIEFLFRWRDLQSAGKKEFFTFRQISRSVRISTREKRVLTHRSRTRKEMDNPRGGLSMYCQKLCHAVPRTLLVDSPKRGRVKA